MSKEKSKTVPTVYDRTAVYAGRRSGKIYMNNKMRQVFVRTDNKEEMYFSGIKGVHLGYTYKCSTDRIAFKPERVFEVPRVDNPEWEAADAIVDAENAQKRAQAKIANSTRPALKAAIAALAPLIRGLNSWDRETLIRHLSIEAAKSSRK